MASIAEQLAQRASQSISQQSPAQDISAGIKVAQQVEELKANREKLENAKQQLGIQKTQNLMGLINTGLTKVPKAGRKAFFKNIVRNRAQQLEIPMDDTVIDMMLADNELTGKSASLIQAFLANPSAEGAAEIADALNDPELSLEVINKADANRLKTEQFKAQYNMSQEKLKTQKEQRARKGVDDLRKELTKHQISKETINLNSGYTRIKLLEETSPASQLAGIFSFMKMLDPGSVVRESEFRAAAKAGELPDKVQNAYNRVIGGELLSPKQVKDFINQAEKLKAAQDVKQRRLNADFINIAKKRGIPTEDLFAGTRVLEEIGAEEPAQAKAIPPGLQLERIKADYNKMSEAVKNEIARAAKITVEELDKLVKGQ